MESLATAPSREVVHALLDVLAPGSRVQAISPLPGSFSNSTHLVEGLGPQDATVRFVIRRYSAFGSYDLAEKARREYSTLALLQAYGIPAPLPFYLDEQGAILGTPGIVVSFVAGKQIVTSADPVRWARTLATMLSQIHAVPCQHPAECLLDANSEALWFADSDAPSETLLAHEDGPLIWRLVRELRQQLHPVAARLVHSDYWPGNVLWQGEQISAVLDWEEAACGDPGYDVAYGWMHLHLLGLEAAAREFLDVYEGATGHGVENLGFWELAAAVRPMPDPARLIPQLSALGMPPCPPQAMRERLRQFIAVARRRTELG
jgi:aminoglycoside phosphotransferase (APT) family kinase protein